MASRIQRAQEGQAAVEAALSLPLAVFLVLGSLQLFLLLQGRLMAEHAAFRAVRAGSLGQGSCRRMLHAAVATLLPTFTRTDSAPRLAQAFKHRNNNHYKPGLDSGHDGEIVWLVREHPLVSELKGQREAGDFDDPDHESLRLEVRLIFWYPMRIPFANWVIARMVLAAWNLRPYDATDPLMPVNDARWPGGEPPRNLSREVLGLFKRRTDSPAGTYVFPIQATAGMRMMTPARREFFTPQDCR
jgi:hypothetical protein